MGEKMKKSKIILLLGAMLLIASLFAFGCAKSFVVTFNGNGGTLVSGTEIQEVKSAEELVAPVYEKEGYTLSWDKDITTIAEETTVNAVWTANKYEVTFILNASDATLEGGSTVEYTYDAVMNLPTPERAGYTFAGWKKGSLEGETLVSGSTFKDTAPFSAYATWTANTYAVTFNLNDAPQSPATMAGDATVNFVYDAAMELPTPSRVGYIFAGWKKGSATGEALTNGQANKYAENFTAYATWVADDGQTFTIALDLAGGNMKAGEENPTTYKASDDAITLKNPVKVGYRFVGWKEGEATPVKNVTILAGSAGNQAYVAVYEQITYTVDFELFAYNDDAELVQLTIGGENDIANVTINAEEALGAKLPTAADFDALTNTQEFAFDYWKIVVGGNDVVIDGNYVFTVETFGEADTTIVVKVVVVSAWSSIR